MLLCSQMQPLRGQTVGFEVSTCSGALSMASRAGSEGDGRSRRCLTDGALTWITG